MRAVLPYLCPFLNSSCPLTMQYMPPRSLTTVVILSAIYSAVSLSLAGPSSLHIPNVAGNAQAMSTDNALTAYRLRNDNGLLSEVLVADMPARYLAVEDRGQHRIAPPSPDAGEQSGRLHDRARSPATDADRHSRNGVNQIRILYCIACACSCQVGLRATHTSYSMRRDPR